MNAIEQQYDEILDSAFDLKLTELIELRRMNLEAVKGQGGADTVGPEARHELKGILKHYAKVKDPFTQCVLDQIKHGLSEDHANRRCAVIKDIIFGTTKWRGKGNPAGKGPHPYVGASEHESISVEVGQLIDSLDELELWELMGLASLELNETASKNYSYQQRIEFACQQIALADGSFPIVDESDLNNVIKASEYAKKPKKVKKHIVTRAKAMDKIKNIPANWEDETQATELAYYPDSPQIIPLGEHDKKFLKEMKIHTAKHISSHAKYLTSDPHPSVASLASSMMSDHTHHFRRISNLIQHGQDNY